MYTSYRTIKYVLTFALKSSHMLFFQKYLNIITFSYLCSYKKMSYNTRFVPNTVYHRLFFIICHMSKSTSNLKRFILYIT